VLTAILGNLSIATETLEPDHPALVCLTSAERAIKRATGLSQQLLTFAKGGTPVRENLSLSELISDVVSFDLTGSNVRPVFNFSGEIGDVHVDRAQLSQVVSNLTLNADQAMPNGGLLEVSAAIESVSEDQMPGASDGRFVVVRFRDTGIGINEADLPRIFEPYFSSKFNGNGLGLATSYSIMKKHHGHIAVESEEDRGTVFTIYLPAAVGPSDGGRRSWEGGSSAAELPRGLRVLLLDDEAIILDVVSRMLATMGAEFTTCESTDDAVTAYQNAFESGQKFDLAIFDLTIPGEPGGRDAVQRIVRFDPKACVVCSSGYADDPVMSNHRKYGFAAAIAKPFRIADLRDLLKSCNLRPESTTRSQNPASR